MATKVGRLVFDTLLTCLVLAFTRCRKRRHPRWRGSIGILGDSYSDEYHRYPPDRVLARNWVEILSSARGLDFGEPTMNGFEHHHPRLSCNWARSAATTADVVSEGLHFALAEQAAKGQVGLAWIFLGGNDFIEALRSAAPEEPYREISDRARENMNQIVRTLLAASDELRVVLVTLPNLFQIPEIADDVRSGLLSGTERAASGEAIRAYNRHLIEWAQRDERVITVDLAAMTRAGDILSPRFIPVGSVRVQRGVAGPELTDAFLPDRRHVGTLVQGVFAQFFLTVMNTHFGAGIRPLSGHEIVALARLENQEDGPRQRKEEPLARV